MATGQRVATAVGAHLVGGLNAPDAETAMRTTARILGRHIRALTDGETGQRSQWIFWQLGKLTAIDGIEMGGTHGFQDAANPDYAEFPALSVDTSVTELPSRSLGCADAAESSYAIFRRLRDDGAVPADVRFQVSIPTPYAPVVAWVGEADQERFFPTCADPIAREVAEIARAIPHDDLAIQYDVAVEIGVLTGNFAAAGELGEKRFPHGRARPGGDDRQRRHRVRGGHGVRDGAHRRAGPRRAVARAPARAAREQRGL